MGGRLWTLILAGGDGRRLSALTRLIAGAPIPKQYCRLLGERSLLEATIERIAPLVPPDRTLAIVNRDHVGLAERQLRALPGANVIVQPSNRDTGPGMLLSLLVLARRDPDALVAVFPSDHFVADAPAFLRHVARAELVVRRMPDRIALLGIPPEHADPGFGYVEPGEPAGYDARAVAAFHEKPCVAAAERLVRRGGLWNSFVMVCQAARMLQLLEAHRGSDVERMRSVVDSPDALADLYASLTPWNFSHDFLARVPEHLVVLRAEGTGWSDWGTRESIERTLRRLDRVPPWFLPAAATA
jgi:mannose-1-phosphate guanylyltransferase